MRCCSRRKRTNHSRTVDINTRDVCPRMRIIIRIEAGGLREQRYMVGICFCFFRFRFIIIIIASSLYETRTLLYYTHIYIYYKHIIYLSNQHVFFETTLHVRVYMKCACEQCDEDVILWFLLVWKPTKYVMYTARIIYEYNTNTVHRPEDVSTTIVETL